MDTSCIHHCEILSYYLQQHQQHHVFRAYFEADPKSQAKANKDKIFAGHISRSKLTASGVTDNSALPGSGR